MRIINELCRQAYHDNSGLAIDFPVDNVRQSRQAACGSGSVVAQCEAAADPPNDTHQRAATDKCPLEKLTI
jgi:hypothetical protein